jgi:HD-GYP domain-containing protein (c-di-GMP phosphodiesterase class II)
MRFATRTFLWSLLPFGVLLAASFWAVQTLVLSAVRDQLRSTVKETQESVRLMRSTAAQGNDRVLRVLAKDSALKAALQVLEDTRNAATRRTIEDQLAEICEDLGLDFMLVSDADGRALAAVLREGGHLLPLDLSKVQPARQGYFSYENNIYPVASVPITLSGDSLGSLSLGEKFDWPGIPVPLVLLHNGKIIGSNAVLRIYEALGARFEDIETGFRNCPPAKPECDMQLHEEAYISLPIDDSAPGDGYQLRSLQSVDAVTRPIQSILRGVFLLAVLGALAGAVLVSVITSRSVVKPITGVIEHLRESAQTGELAEFETGGPGGTGLFRKGDPTHEIRELMRNFNSASAAIREGQGRLKRAIVEVIEAMTSALDARDPYTAGHSRRVSEYACEIGRVMGLSRDELNEIRIGALLHDIGKIGVSDSILLKPGKLTHEENGLIQQHPTIGRRILEGVQGLMPYLAVVELHHENWDGSGYPHGLRGEGTPITARIVKIADAYDAMTSNRPYREGMSHEKAMSVLEQISGSQLDPSVLEAFRRVHVVDLKANISDSKSVSLRRLSEAVGSSPMSVPHAPDGNLIGPSTATPSTNPSAPSDHVRRPE